VTLTLGVAPAPPVEVEPRPGGVDGLTVADLIRVGRRHSPRRHVLFVSTILGKHLNVAPSTLLAAGMALGARVEAALAGTDPIAVEALCLFVTCLGRTAGDLALVFMSRGGVFLTGGIVQKIVPALKAGNFRSAFEDKAPHSEMMRSIPVYVITHPLAALLGLAAYARTPWLFGVQTAGRRWKAQDQSASAAHRS